MCALCKVLDIKKGEGGWDTHNTCTCVHVTLRGSLGTCMGRGDSVG